MRIYLYGSAGEHYDYEDFSLSSANTRYHRNGFSTNPSKCTHFSFSHGDEELQLEAENRSSELIETVFPGGQGLHGKDDDHRKRFLRVFNKIYNQEIGVLSSERARSFSEEVTKLMRRLLFAPIAISLSKGARSPSKHYHFITPSRSLEPLPGFQTFLADYLSEIPSSDLLLSYDDPIAKVRQTDPIDIAFIGFQADPSFAEMRPTFYVSEVKYHPQLFPLIRQRTRQYLERYFYVTSENAIFGPGISNDILLSFFDKIVAANLEKLQATAKAQVAAA